MIRLAILALMASVPTASGESDARHLYRAGDAANPIACASCHGLSGEGSKEGGVQVPAVARIGYDDADLARLLANGTARDGRHVALMPRFALSAVDLRRLNAYLAILGSDADGDPGVSSDRVQIAAALPLSGPRADEARDMVERLQRLVSETNAAGGLYGRRLVLAVVDLAAPDPSVLVNSFALVASPPSSRIGDQPLVGALSPTPARAGDEAEATFYLLPRRVDDLSRLLAFVHERRVGPVLAQSAMWLTVQAIAASGRALNRARFVAALETLDPVTITTPNGGSIRFAFPDGDHVARTELLSGLSRGVAK